MAADLDALAERLFAGVMAPLVLGGPLRPGHAIGARAALALGEGRLPGDRALLTRVQEARVRRARRFVPVDELPDPTAADWALAASLHDLLQAANPEFDAPLRRGAATRILDVAVLAIDRVPLAATTGEVVARDAWLGRAPEVARTDTEVRWWVGSRWYLGVDPPPRMTAWPRVRRVEVIRRPVPLLELAPLAVDRERLTEALGVLLARSPLTDLASCGRPAPLFAWSRGTLGLLGSRSGRVLAFRALARAPGDEADAALGRATRELLERGRTEAAVPVLSLLAERVLMDAMRAEPPPDAEGATGRDVNFAQALGALAAREALERDAASFSERDRARLNEAIARAASSAAGQEAQEVLRGSTKRADSSAS